MEIVEVYKNYKFFSSGALYMALKFDAIKNVQVVMCSKIKLKLMKW